MVKVGIVGGTGYTGVELLRLLARHPNVEVQVITSRSEAGMPVAADTTVCLIEVMKLFNTIKAGVAGKVVKILAQNAATVKKDEALLWIEPDER